MGRPYWMPEQADVDELTRLLDLLENFSTNEQRARYLITSNWMRERGETASRRLRNLPPMNYPA